MKSRAIFYPPRVLAIAMVSVTLVYIAIQVVAQGILGAALGQSTAPLADSMARMVELDGRISGMTMPGISMPFKSMLGIASAIATLE